MVLKSIKYSEHFSDEITEIIQNLIYFVLNFVFYLFIWL